MVTTIMESHWEGFEEDCRHYDDDDDNDKDNDNDDNGDDDDDDDLFTWLCVLILVG